MTGFYFNGKPGTLGKTVSGGAIFGPIPYRNYFVESVFSYFPKGAVWTPKRGGFFEGVLLGLMGAFDYVRNVLSDLAYIRSAELTTQLDDLERDYGIVSNPALSNSERRAYLNSRINAINNTGSAQEMQAALRLAGFDVSVYPNDPAIDPAGVVGVDSKLLVNGEIFQPELRWIMTANSLQGYAGKTKAKAGVFVSNSKEYFYTLPTDSNAWPFIFFVGGAASFGGSGEILTVDFVSVPSSRRVEFEEIILKYKPLFCWGLLNVIYT